jgi:hypothetical protein
LPLSRPVSPPNVTKPTGGHPGYIRLLQERTALHVEKSGGYGTDGDPFANFTAVAQLTGQPRYLYPVHRTIEKLTRVLSLHAQGRVGELEEEFKDCASLLDCATTMLRCDLEDAVDSD